jgi:5-methyltetrahydrofolate--homocysteine methyltransferase
MGDEGLPNSVNERYENGSRLVEGLTSAGIPPSDIYLDPLVRPVSTDSQAGVVLLETIRRFRETWPEVHIVCGLSNISYGMPVRRLINQSFLVLALQAGLDAAILDPMDQQLMGLLYATRFLLGKDEYGVDYLKAFRSGRFE